MSRRKFSEEAGPVDRAMNEVLAAEQTAREAVDRCRAEADAVLAAAEERARRIVRRTEHRIKAAHRTADGGVDRVLRELFRTEPGAGPGSAVDAEAARIARAVERLAKEMIGEGP